jgi:hypothetical protein
MSFDDAATILANLHAVEAERRRRRADPGFDARVLAVKRFQHARFERTYADLLKDARWRDAARFFLDELYGPGDFSERDAQFMRIVPALVRLFPVEIVATVRVLSDLHALSERLDAAMAEQLPDADWTLSGYAVAWRTVGEPMAREHQIEWMLQIGRALLRYTRHPLLRHSLRMMRGPARAAGLSTLQNFLERGFETFRSLDQPELFLDLIASRERTIAEWLFETTGGKVAPKGLEPDSRAQ